MAGASNLRQALVAIVNDLDFTIEYLVEKYRQNLLSINRIIDKMQDKSIAHALNKNRAELIEIKSISTELEKNVLEQSDAKGYLLKDDKQQLAVVIDETETFVKGLGDSNKLVELIEHLDKGSIITPGTVDLDPEAYERIVSQLRALKLIAAEFLANATALSKTVKNLGFFYQSIA